MTLSPKFLVFDSKSGPEREDGGVIYCSSQHANVQWPKSVRRGRPRKGGLCSFYYVFLPAGARHSKSFDHVDSGTANDHYARQIGCFAWQVADAVTAELCV